MGFSKREKIFLVAILALSLMGWLLLCRPRMQEASHLKAELAHMTRRAEGARGTIQASERLKRELDAAQTRLQYLEAKVPSHRNFSSILAQLAEPARRHHIRILSTKPVEGGKEGPESLYQTLPIEVEIRCRYLDFGQYLEDLHGRPLLLNVESLQIRRAEKESPTLSVHMVLNSYIWRAREEGKES
jgi:Tfp pilus assembly protein PilO